MKTTILYWDRAEGKTEEIINIIHDNKRTTQDKLLIIPSLSEIGRLKAHYNIPTNVTIMTSSELEHGHARGLRPEIILIDNAEMLDEKVFEHEIIPFLIFAKELIITGSSIKLFKHYKQPEDVRYISHAKEFIYKVEEALTEIRRMG